MYLKTHKRKKNGKVNEYYSIVEKRKVANECYVQKTVLYLGEISDSQKKSWNKSIKVLNEQNELVHKTLFALHDDDDICENIDAIPLRLSGMKLQKPRAFGDCWLGCEIFDQLRSFSRKHGRENHVDCWMNFKANWSIKTGSMSMKVFALNILRKMANVMCWHPARAE